MSDVFERIRGQVPDHTITTILGTVVAFYLSESPAIAVKEVVVLAIENESDMTFTSNQYVTSHTHDDPNISSVIAWERSPLQDKQFVESPSVSLLFPFCFPSASLLFPPECSAVTAPQVHAAACFPFHEHVFSRISRRQQHLGQKAAA